MRFGCYCSPPRAALQIDKCFGFDSAVEEAQRALLAAKVEASSGYKGIGIVKLMGRDSGFIAMQASLASGAFFLLLFPVAVCFLLFPVADRTRAHRHHDTCTPHSSLCATTLPQYSIV